MPNMNGVVTSFSNFGEKSFGLRDYFTRTSFMIRPETFQS